MIHGDKNIVFKYSLNIKVYCVVGGKPKSGTIKRRGYQETWHDDLDDIGGYLTNNFYEVRGWDWREIFHESDFGKKVFTDAAEFAEVITQPD